MAATSESTHERRFEKKCLYCGARFDVIVTRPRVMEEEDDFGCPECGKVYSTHSGSIPQVELIEPRTDGKTDRYSETLF